MHILIAFQAFVHLLLQYSSATRHPLVHRDHNLSFEARMKHDSMRVASLTRRLAANEVDRFKTDLKHIEGAEYFAEVGVGTPPQNQTLVIDTGSDILWVKCQCDSCDDTRFDPSNSTSFADVGCGDPTCYKVDGSNSGCGNLDSPCTYDLIYGDGTETNGTMAMDSITIGYTTVPNVTVGCSHNSDGLLSAIGDGVLGLGGGSLSIVSQSGGLIGGVFSYCLGTGNSTGWLGFGYSNVSRDTNWTSLISNPKHPSYYYIDVVGMSVGGEALNISADTFRVDPDTGDGGVIIDTGTTVTRLVKGAYEALRDKFKVKMSNHPTVPGVSILDTCYNLAGVDLNTVPNVSFTFSSRGMYPPSITHVATNVLIMEGGTIYCLAFASSQSLMSIIGNTQQQGTQITIKAGGYIGFGPGTC